MILSIIDILNEFTGLKTVIPAVLLAFGTTWAGWFFGRRKQKEETKSMEQENIARMLETHRKEFESQHDFTQRLVIALRQEILENHKELSAYRKENTDLNVEVSRLKINVAKLIHLSCVKENCLERIEIKTYNKDE